MANPVGRPTIFSAELSEKICKFVQEGKSTEQIADILCINPRTIYFWMSNNKEFLQNIKEARQAACEIVEASLYHRAIGYSVPEEKVFCNANGEVTTHVTMKHYPPDPTAMIFWLKNRQPEKWKDKTEIEQTGTVLIGAASREQMIELVQEASEQKQLEDKKKLLSESSDE